MSTLSYFPEFRLVQLQLPIASRLKTKALIELTAKYPEPHRHDLCTYTGPETQLRFGGEARLDTSAYLERL
jgi:hypothetical protein